MTAYWIATAEGWEQGVAKLGVSADAAAGALKTFAAALAQVDIPKREGFVKRHYRRVRDRKRWLR